MASLYLPFSGIASDSGELWTKNCKKCHGDDGKGATAMGKKFDIRDYTDPTVQATVTDEQIAEAIRNGIKNDAGKQVMQPLGDKLSDEEINTLVAYVRSLKTE